VTEIPGTELLFEDSLAPLTSEVGFVDVPAARLCDAYLEWQRPIQSKRRVELRTRPITGDLRAALQSLLPLNAIEARRCLFVPTASAWTAFFENRATGTDASSSMSVLSRLLRCRAIRVVAIPDGRRSQAKKSGGRYGALILEIFDPSSGDPRNLSRSVVLANDGGRWVFETSGVKLPFEDDRRYDAPKLRDRLSLQVVSHYLGALGVRAFDPAFYLPDGAKALLVEKQGATVAGEKEMRLEDVQASF
jgi:hypothetical protein